ncbi:hypothetical protein GRF29_96g1410373 [Pseudopithomyces chartarum]|uniref:Uncharacterized protein n=1 Tax=Pseudopithomyces chartarum TaxID=1892770 RepID=A0AAN6LXN4_9PLEO|nr:hypothetical protein GRF29_96g1410373 [Pseudopithomyces chartarum]
MSPRAVLLLAVLASSATAQITTAYLLPNSSYGTNRLRFVASIINATNDELTLAAHLDDESKYTALGEWGTDTWTFGPTYIIASTSQLMPRGPRPSEASDASAYSLRCDVVTTATTADCTVSQGPSLVVNQCNTRHFSRSQQLFTDVWTYSQDGEVGTETIVRTFPGTPTTSQVIPEWCPNETNLAASDMTAIEVPESARVRTFTKARTADGDDGGVGWWEWHGHGDGKPGADWDGEPGFEV